MAAKFDKLRAAYRKARNLLSEHQIDMAMKYGNGYRDSWLSSADAKKGRQLLAAEQKAGGAMMAHIEAISPRDWSHGVPVAWVLSDLSYEDAVRPEGERLSVVPPLSYGATRPRT